MSGRKVLLDTNVLIQASRQQLDLAGLFAAYDEFYVSVITYMEDMHMILKTQRSGI
jgi:predicted nucleic acid-binding protein